MLLQLHGENVKVASNIHYHLPLVFLIATCGLHFFVIVSINLCRRVVKYVIHIFKKAFYSIIFEDILKVKVLLRNSSTSLTYFDLKFTKIVWRQGSARTRWGSSRRSPDLLAGFRGGSEKGR